MAAANNCGFLRCEATNDEALVVLDGGVFGCS